MKSFRFLASFLLPVALVVSAVPRQDTQDTKTQSLHFNDGKEVDADIILEENLEADPSIMHQIESDLVRGAPWVDVEVDEQVLLEMLRRHVEETEETDEGQDNEASAARHRGKRDTVFSGDVDVENQRGGRRIKGSVNVDHDLNSKHSIGGSVGIDHTRITGLGSSTDYNAGVRYTFTPNKRTSLSLGASRNWGSSGRGTNLGLSFSHKFGRKRRSPDRI